jgi:amino acid adenylation domain-containing protein
MLPNERHRVEGAEVGFPRLFGHLRTAAGTFATLPHVTVSNMASPSLQAAFRSAADRHPQRIALEQGQASLDYRALASRVTALRGALHAHGVGPGDRVALLLPRSFDLIAATLAILETGAAYVPLDPLQPQERLQWMFDDVRAKACVASADAPKLDLGSAASIDPATVGAAKADGAVWEGTPEDPAYVMYTSGSTGRPKGVVIPHRGVLRLVCGATFMTFGPDTCFLQLAPPSFDAATLEIFGPLLNGGRLALMPPGPPSLSDIASALRRHRVTTLWLTSGLFHAMVDERLPDLGELRELLAGGDVLLPSHVARVLGRWPSLRLINGYGPTENTTFTTCHTIREVEPGRSIPIGKPIDGTTCHVIGPSGEEVAPGESGELVTGGLGLALGYLDRPELTAEKFVRLASGERCYRTGDRVRQLPSGDLEVLGRLDDQFKVRGFRIEPGEVEAQLTAHPKVREAAAGVREAGPGDKRLVAWYVEREPVTAQELRAFLAGRVPDFLVPSALLAVPKLLLNVNGKVDRGALPDPFARASAAAPAVAKNEMERGVLDLYREVLKTPAASPSQNFFELGGTSLHIALLHERLEKKLGTTVEITRLFEFPTASLLAGHLSNRRGDEGLGARAQQMAQRQKAAQAAAAARGRKL